MTDNINNSLDDFDKSLSTEGTQQILSILKNKYNFNQTSSSIGFNTRLVQYINNLYQNIPILNQSQNLVLFGVLLGGILVMNQHTPDYRIDKSPTTSLVEDFNPISFNTPISFLKDNYIDEQPHYSHNSAVELAKKLNVSIDYSL